MTQDIYRTARTIEGTGPDLVLIHGMGLNRGMWQWMLPALTARFRVTRYDLLGHGESAAPPSNCTLNELLDQLDGLLVDLDIERAAVAGFSLGGTLAQAFAAVHPEKTAAVAVLNSSYRRDPGQRAAMQERLRLSVDTGPAATVDAAIERWFTKSFRDARSDVTDLVRTWMLANDPKNYGIIYTVLTEGDDAVLRDGRILADAIADIQCPALVLTGAEDANSTPAMAAAMAAAIPGGRSAVIPVLRHMGLAEDPDAFNAVLVPFLEASL
jgi:(E)-2-((N-methylformamido)methylene)succinate hydrolase